MSAQWHDDITFLIGSKRGNDDKTEYATNPACSGSRTRALSSCC